MRLSRFNIIGVIIILNSVFVSCKSKEPSIECNYEYSCFKGSFDEDAISCFSVRLDNCLNDWDKLSNVEKNMAIEVKSEIIHDIAVYYIQAYLRKYSQKSSIRDVGLRWSKLATAVENFLELKSTLHWYTHTTGTAGASYAPWCRHDLAIAYYIFAGSMLKASSGKEFSDNFELLGDSNLLPFDSIGKYHVPVNEMVKEYLDVYLEDACDSFEIAIEFYDFLYEKEEIEKIYNQWRSETSQTIIDISNLMQEICRKCSVGDLNTNLSPVETWLYYQIPHVLQYFD